MYAISFDNPWLKSVQTARRRLPAWAAACAAAVLVPLLVLGGGQLAGQIVRRMGQGDDLPTVAGHYAVYLLATFGLIALATFAVKRFWEARPRPVGGWPPVRGLGAGLLVGAGGLTLAIGLAAATGVVVPGGASNVGSSALAGVGISLVWVAGQAGAEEYVFRGWLQPLLCASWGPWVGLIATSVMFGAMHMIGGIPGPIAIANMMLGGLVFGLLALRTGGLWAPFTAHWIWNWAENSVVGLIPNPGVGPFGSLADFDLRGPAIWSGGAQMLNGSLAVTIVLAALAILLSLAGAARRG